jgi:hypothetical protein
VLKQALLLLHLIDTGEPTDEARASLNSLNRLADGLFTIRAFETIRFHAR